MPHIEIVEATREHVQVLRSRLRADDALEMTAIGEDPGACLWHSWRGSPYRRTALVDGAVAAMWGVHGDMLAETGIPWLLTAPVVETLPVSMLKVGRRETGFMSELYPYLENQVMASYRRAVRFIRMMGFTVEAPEPFRGVPFRRFWFERA